MSSWRREVNCEGKKPGKYFWIKLKISTWPTGVSGAIRMIANGMKVSRSLAVLRSACTCRPMQYYAGFHWPDYPKPAMVAVSCTP